MSRISQELVDSGLAQLDEIDRRIVAVLQVDGRRSFTKLAKEIGTSESVVRYRVQRLERAKILQIVGIADPLKIGFDLMSMIGVRVVPGRLESVVEEIKTLPETSYVASLAGSFDLIVEVVCRDTAHYNQLLTKQLHRIDGVASTESFLILEIHKMAYGWGVGEQNAVPIAPSRPGGAGAPPADPAP
ncbi:Lrp/AsnC family transcriptional regulator [Nocardiopsis ansamitocini]|nr:Lrp/AsnC family transcriptional regulator [Nocardiopsis ansamitocini]